MLASDLNNPDFVGAHNPDDRLFVEFYMHEPEDMNKSIEQGKKVKGEAQPYVRIQVPGDKTSVIETPVREDHKARWPQKWLYFQMKEGLVAGEHDIPGWKLEEWDYLSPDQLRELKYMRFSVVEQLAGASDEQTQRLGMGGMSLREAARRALRDRMGAEVKEEIQKKDREMQELRERLALMEEFMKSQAAPKAVVADTPSVEVTVDPAPDGGGGIVEPDERSALVEQYTEKFGKKPHHKLSVEKIRVALASAP